MSEVIGKADFSAYQSPIELIADKVRMEQDEYVVRCVQKMGVKADRDELIRALNYDRGQYEKGYLAGFIARSEQIVHCRDCKNKFLLDGVWQCRYGLMMIPEGFCNYGESEVDDAEIH